MGENRKINYPYDNYEIYDRIPPEIEAMSLEEIEAELEKLMNE